MHIVTSLVQEPLIGASEAQLYEDIVLGLISNQLSDDAQFRYVSHQWGNSPFLDDSDIDDRRVLCAATVCFFSDFLSLIPDFKLAGVSDVFSPFVEKEFQYKNIYFHPLRSIKTDEGFKLDSEGTNIFAAQVEQLFASYRYYSFSLEQDGASGNIVLEDIGLSKNDLLSWLSLFSAMCGLNQRKRRVYVSDLLARELDGLESLFENLVIYYTHDPVVYRHAWSNDPLLTLSGSAALSQSLFDHYDSWRVFATGSVHSLNPSIYHKVRPYLDTYYRDFVESFAGVNLEDEAINSLILHETVEKKFRCTLMTSMYDDEEYLDGFLENISALENYDQLEHVIVRPNSAANEYSAIEDYLKFGFNVIDIWLPENMPLYNVWNMISSYASSPYLSNANLDDRRSPDHLVKLLPILDNKKEISVVNSALKITDKKNIRWEASAKKPVWFGSKIGYEYSYNDLYEDSGTSFRSVNIPHCMPVWRSTLHSTYGYFQQESFGPAADWAYWLKLSKSGVGFYNQGEALGLYLLNPNSYARREGKDFDFNRVVLDELVLNKDESQKLYPVNDYLGEYGEHKSYLDFLLSLALVVARGQDTHVFADRWLKLDLESDQNCYNQLIVLLKAVGSEGRLPDSFVEQGAITELLINISRSLAVHRTLSKIETSPLISFLEQVFCQWYLKSVNPIFFLLNARLKFLVNDERSEAYYLNKAYENSSDYFWKNVNRIYQFDRSLQDLLSKLHQAPKYATFENTTSTKIWFFPDNRKGNAYQSLLYQDFEKKGGEVLAVKSLDRFLEYQDRMKEGDVLHIHWVNKLFVDYPGWRFSFARGRFFGVIKKLKAKGVSVWWTVHNVQNHDGGGSRREIHFRKDLYTQCDRVFVHHPLAINLLRPWLKLSRDIDQSKIEVLEHGSYPKMAIPQKALDARKHDLRIDQDDFVILIYGQLRAYKDLPEVIGVLKKHLVSNQRLKLLMAGKVMCKKTLNALTALPQSQLIIDDAYISEEGLAEYLNLASCVLLSYKNILVSGTLIHAMSYSKPVIVPGLGALQGYVSHGENGFVYKDLEALSESLRALINSDQRSLDRMGASSKACADQLWWPEFEGQGLQS